MKLQVLFMEHWLGIEVEFGLGTAVTDGEIGRCNGMTLQGNNGMAEQRSSNGSSSRELGIPGNEIVFVSSIRPGSDPVKKLDKFVADGAVDFRGHPSVKSKTGNWKACVLIFGGLQTSAFRVDTNIYVVFLISIINNNY